VDGPSVVTGHWHGPSHGLVTVVSESDSETMIEGGLGISESLARRDRGTFLHAGVAGVQVTRDRNRDRYRRARED
jgi:hypothetical protein